MADKARQKVSIRISCLSELPAAIDTVLHQEKRSRGLASQLGEQL
jgi:hypothetical protein